jgi:hypothetical protein
MKTKKTILATLAGACLLTVSAVAQPITYSTLLSGPNESPANASPGTGLATVILDSTLHTMSVSVSFSGLVGTTTASHIHVAPSPFFSGNGGVATTVPTFTGFPLGVLAGSYFNLMDMTQVSSYNPSFITANGGTTATAEAALFSAIATGRAYLNIHSSVFGGGEIRGYLVPVPEPSSIALVGVGGMLLARTARRRD